MTAPAPTELLPCPFCGGKVIAEGYVRDGRMVSCMRCHASVRAFQPNAVTKAAELWNTRQAASVERAAIPRKIVCHAVGDRCLGCKHYQGQADVCDFAPPVERAEVAGEAETCPVCGNSPPTALCKHDPRFIALASPPRSEGVRASEVQSGDATCYIERSKVREILIASNIDNESTAEVLTEVDALPIFVAGDFAPAAQASPSLRKVEAEGGFNLVIADKWAAFFPAECESQIDFLIERLSVPSADRGGK